MAMNRDIGKAADIPFCVEKTHRFMERENKKLPQYGRTGAPVSLAVLVFYVPIITERGMAGNMILRYIRTAYLRFFLM